MSRMSLFNSPFLLGFDHLEQLVAHVAKGSAEGYPPHNIERIGADGLRITLAVAGFDIDDLEVCVADRRLTVRGRRRDDDSGRVFLYRGIAQRQFQRAWVLADGLEVRGARLDNGLLHIDLRRVDPDAAARTVPISKAAGNGAGAALAIGREDPLRRDDRS